MNKPLAPRVSILTPTFNHERYVGACIESVLAQTEPSWEMLILDDGSTDATGDVVNRYRDRRIRYIRQDNHGLARLAETYNLGLARSAGAIVAILEGDDYWPPDKIAKLLPAFDDPSVVLAYGKASVVSSVGAPSRRSIPTRAFLRTGPPGACENEPVGRAAVGMLDPRWLTFMYPCSVLIRRGALERIGGFQRRPGLPPDYPTFLALTLEGRFHFSNQVTGFWRVHASGTTANQFDSILRAAEVEARAFIDRSRGLIPASDEEWEAIAFGWSAAQGYLAAREGRRQLVRRRWSDARAEFRKAAKRGRWATRAIGYIGLASAVAGFPIEWIFRLTRRPTYRLAEDGSLRVDV